MGAEGAAGLLLPQDKLGDKQQCGWLATAPGVLHRLSRSKQNMVTTSLPPFKHCIKCLLWPIITLNFSGKGILGKSVRA